MLGTIKRKRSEEGFTLIELLIVIIILAILAVIVVFAVGSTTKNAAAAACKTTIKTVQTAVAAYDTQVGSYPGTLTALKGTATATGQSVGPWLKNLPATGSGANKNYWFTNTINASGNIFVGVKGHATTQNVTTITPCNTA